MKSITLVVLPVLLTFFGCVMIPDPGPISSNSKVEAWPNPATTVVFVNVNNTGAAAKLKIFDGEGQLCFDKDVPNGENQYQVDIKDSPEGTYHVVVELEHEIVKTKFIKLKS